MLDEYQKQIAELVRQAGAENPVEYVDIAVRELAMKTMNNLIDSCAYCDICNKRKGMVTGNAYGSILAICEYPQEEKSLDIKQIIEKTMEEAGLNLEQIIWVNAVNCYPDGVPQKSEIKNCSVFLDYAIDTFKPLYILSSGNISYSALGGKESISKVHGEWFNVRDNIPSMAVYSPSIIEKIRDKDMKNEWISDFREDIYKFAEAIREEYPDSELLVK